MKAFVKFVAAAILSFAISTAVFADTLELKDGRIVQGKYLGGTQAILRFEINGEVQTFRTIDVVGLTFTGRNMENMEPANGPAPEAPPREMSRRDRDPNDRESRDDRDRNDRDRDDRQHRDDREMSRNGPPPTLEPGQEVTLPANQAILVRMIDSVDSSVNHVGDLFHASLETDLTLNDFVVARRGSDVYGRLDYVKEAGHISGRAELQLELTRIMIDGKEFPLVSSDYNLQGKSRGNDSAKKVGGGAVVGAIIGAIAGGGRGAAIGAGVGSAAGAGVQIVTKGQQVKVPSETVLEFRLQQPVTVTSTTQQGSTRY
jgi:hypothetical protein